MPGVKSITWNAENEARFLRLLVVHANVQVDKGAAERIAAELGPSVTSSAITTHIQILRRKASQAGVALFSPAATTKKRIAPASAGRASKKPNLELKSFKDELSDDDDGASLASLPKTPKKPIIGGSDGADTPTPAARISPRKTKGTGKKYVTDLTATDVDGLDEETKAAVKQEEPSSEDELATDEEYKGDEVEYAEDF